MTSLLELVEFWARTPSVLIAVNDPKAVGRLMNVLRNFDCEIQLQLLPDKNYEAAFVGEDAPPELLLELKKRHIPLVVLSESGGPLRLEFAPFVVIRKTAITTDCLSELTSLLHLRAPPVEHSPNWRPVSAIS